MITQLSRLHEAVRLDIHYTVGLRLALSVAASGRCACGTELDALGEHALECKRGIGRSARHTEVNARIRQALLEAGSPSILEHPGITRTGGKRPEGENRFALRTRLSMAWYVTIILTSAQPYRLLTSVNSGEAAVATKDKKRFKYSALQGRIDFRPVGWEMLGPFGPSVTELFDSIASRIRARTGDAVSRIRVYRRIAAAVQIGNAACIVEAHSRVSTN